MAAQNAETFSFRWKSWLGAAVVLFLLYGALNIFAAIMVPISLHQGGAGAIGGLIVSNEADAKVIGRSLVTLPKEDPGLNAYLVAFMDTMCMMMMAFAILQIGVAWFALRRGHRWALWVLAVADLWFIPYVAAFANLLSGFGVSGGDVITSLGGFWIITTVAIVLATIVGRVGLGRARKAVGAAA